jgi:hypothetical protein
MPIIPFGEAVAGRAADHRLMEPGLRSRAWRHRVALVVPVLLLVAACGEDDDGQTATVCDARDDLDSSLGALSEIDLTAEGTDPVEAAVGGV